MKSFTKLFMVVVAGMFAFSCVTDTTEDLGVNLGEGQSTTISLSLEESRTHLGVKDPVGNEYPLFWSEGDKIAVNGKASDALGVEYHGQQQATFKFTGTLLNYPYNIVYPAPAEGVTAEKAGNYPVTFKTSQVYTAGTFAEGSVPMYGYVANENAATTLNHLAGVLRLAPYGNATLKMLVITAENGKLAGNFDVDTEGNLTAHADATNSVTVTFGEGLTLGATEADAKPIYVAVPAGDYGKVSVTLITDKDSMTMGFNTSGENENGEPKAIKAGKVREFAAFEYKANSDTTGDFFIYDEASLLNFAENAATIANAKVVADIDMTGESWTAIDNYSGVFDGGNFKIKGLKAPLFGETTNAITIKNVHLTDVDITISKSFYAGAIALYIKNAASIVENCSAEGKLLVTGELKDASSSTFFGGCFGRIEEATIISKITNKVDVTVAFSTVHTGTGFIYVGGCVGLGDWVKMEECHNDGDIQVTDVSYYILYTGGVVSSIRSAVNCYKNLSNDGDITVNAKSSTSNTFVSGITAQHYSCILEGKHINTGDITVTGDNYALGIYISGIIGYPSNGDRILTITDAELSNSGTLTWSGTVTNSTVPNLHMGGIFTGSYGKFTGTAKSIVNTGDLICSGSIGAYAHIGGIVTGRNKSGFNATSAYDNFANAKCYCKIQAIGKENCWIGMLSSVAYSSTAAFKNSSVGGSIQTTADDEGKLTLDNYMQYLYRQGSTISEGVIANIDKIGWLEDINSTPQYKEVAGIEIDSAEKLLQFAADVKKDPALAEIVAITANIDMAGKTWTPIEGFAGSFNGRKHEIKGLTAPLFGETQAVEIKNVNLTDVNISTSTLHTNNTLGAIACYASNTGAVIKDCSAAGSLTFTGSDTVIASKQICIAGLIGCATTTNEISGLTNSVNVTMDNDGSGWFAGCIGKSYAETLKNCQNLGTIEYKSGNSQTTQAVYIMGVCSYSLGLVSNCTNGRLGEDGKPTEEGKVIYNGTITDNAYLSVSGICCVFAPNSTFFDIENCTNYAPIVLGGNRNAGGAKWSAVSGIASGPTYSSYSPEIRNCKNYGEIIIETNSPTTSPLYAAGIVAGYSRGKLTSLENYGQITVTDTAKSSGTETCVAGIQATGFWVEGDYPNIYTDVKNAGDIVVKATVENMPNLEVSGVANSKAHLNSPITNCRCLCNIEAVGFTNVGMITGSARNAADPRVKNCAVGGKITTRTTAQGDAERPREINLSAGNYFNYIYGSADWTGVADYDGCGYIESIDDATPDYATPQPEE